MCLALPAKVVSVEDGDRAVVELGGVRQRISIALVDGVTPGDYVVVHVGYALTRLDPVEAEKTLSLVGQLAGQGAPEPKTGGAR